MNQILWKVLSVGAAGNKAAIELIEREVMQEENISLINSTIKDIPESYRKLAIEYENGSGCGKEKDLAASLCLNSIQSGKTGSKLDSLLEPNDIGVIVAASTSGGTGAGSAPILCKYARQVLGVPVQCFLFTGFETDVRELQNTIETIQELSEDITVQIISNKKFLKEANNNKFKAEKLANLEFVNRVKILLGCGMVDSSQNIDDTDLYKVTTTPGYMISGRTRIDKLKNVDQFNDAVIKMIDETKSLETTKSMKRLAVIINTHSNPDDINYIDYDFTVFKDKFGIPYEVFTHVQNNDEIDEEISFMAAGLKMPLDEIKDVYKKYKEQSDKVDKSKDKFFDTIGNLKGNAEDDIFNTKGKQERTNPNTQGKKSSFFNSYNNINNNNENSINEKMISKEDFMKKNF